MRRLYTKSGLAYIFLIFTAVGLLQFWYRYLDFVARGRTVNWLVPFLEQMTGNYVSLVLFVVGITTVVLRFRPDLDPISRWLPAHALAMPVYSIIHTSLMWGWRIILFPLLGLGVYDYGAMPVRYWMEFPSDLIDYALNAGALIFFLRMREANVNQVHVAKLEGDLARARLESLSLQLQPHFLFNSLNAVACLIHEDPRRADLMLSRLAGYLRRTLQSGSEPRVTLEQELETLDLYLTMMKARFEDNLIMDLKVDEWTMHALAPQFILQPIVENAIQHGFDPVSASIRVEISASQTAADLILSVRDHGPGLDPAAAPRIGLANTRSRLDHLYGDKASFRIANANGGGAEVEIRIPLELGPAAAAPARARLETNDSSPDRR
jgi:signal transduction histidine kinase